MHIATRAGALDMRTYLAWDMLVRVRYQAAIAQLGERQTEDLKVPGSIPGLGILDHEMKQGAQLLESQDSSSLFSCVC